ncbi:phosphoglucosamine mutase [Hydrogenophaga sp. OTU3427]|uniref:phosphoglucosamine mutase n=1 Tax=Hydrogenophaga sp. OTU3427 TaxID=3043856 RepID=UPI00313E7C81
MTTQKMFGTDGVRAQVGMEPMTPHTIMRLAHAAGQLLGEQRVSRNMRPAVAIGTDTRVSAPMFEAALQAGFSAAGVDTVMCGELPTPGIAYLTRMRGYQAGVVVSASHNPFDDNGIKFFSASGDKLPDETERAIELAMAGPLPCVPSARLGLTSQLRDAGDLYVDFCRRSMPTGLHLRGLKIVVDAAHGACHQVAPAVFRQLGAQVVAVGISPNGLNINNKVGATVPKHLCQAVLAHHADLGVALDGDGDRLVMVDAEGRIYGGDELLYVLAVDAQINDGLQGGVVGTLMSNQGLERALSQRGLAFARAAVGDRHVLSLLKQRGWRLGGEGSGHLIGLDWHSTGDGVMAALRVMAAMQRSRRTLGQLCEGLRMNAQCLVNVPLAAGAQMADSEWVTHFQQRAEQELGGAGRVLLRASGTEPVVRVLVECSTLGKARAMAHRLAAEVGRMLNHGPASAVPASGDPAAAQAREAAMA